MDKEIWKPVINYEGYYEVSSHGRVRSMERITPHKRWGKMAKNKTQILKLYVSPNGYKMVVLSKNTEKKNCSVHRIVASAFIPNPNKLPIVNHKDENKLNNRADNLEWCSQKYNINYGTSLKKRAKSQSISKKGKHYSPRTEFKRGTVLECHLHPVLCLETGALHNSVKDACKAYGVSRSTVWKSYKTGRTIKGYTFKLEQKTGF